MRFVFDDPEPAELSREWIEDLAHSANSSGGIMLIAEDLSDVPVDPDGAGLSLSVGKVEVDELSIDKLSVAGTVLPGQSAPDGQDYSQGSEISLPA